MPFSCQAVYRSTQYANKFGARCPPPIRAESGQPAWRQTIFYPFALTARHAVGDVLRVEPVTPLYATAQYGDVPVADVVATVTGRPMTPWSSPSTATRASRSTCV